MTFLHQVTDGPEDAPLLVLGSSIGTTHEMWDLQIGALSEHRRVVRFDTRGHGGSPAPAGPYTVAELASDVITLVDDLGGGTFDYCGLSLGGAIGQQIALDHPDRVESLVLCCTAAWFGGPQTWRERADRVRAEGVGWLPEAIRPRWFTDGDLTPYATALLDAQRQTDPEGYAGCCEALAEFDVRDRLGEIAAPTLVVAGEHDLATPAEMTSALAAGIPGATLATVPDAAHLANVDQPDAIAALITDHLDRRNP